MIPIQKCIAKVKLSFLTFVRKKENYLKIKLIMGFEVFKHYYY